MMNSFKFNFPTFDTEEFNEIILDVPLSTSEENQNSKTSDDKIVSASVNEMATLIVTQMMTTVRQDLSSLNK